MPFDMSQHRPLISRDDFNPAERDAAGHGTVIVLALAVAVFAAITTVVFAYPRMSEMIALIEQ